MKNGGPFRHPNYENAGHKETATGDQTFTFDQTSDGAAVNPDNGLPEHVQQGTTQHDRDADIIQHNDFELPSAADGAESFSSITSSLVRSATKFPYTTNSYKESPLAALQKGDALENKAAQFCGGLAVSWLYEEAFVTPLSSPNSNEQHSIASAHSMPEAFKLDGSDHQAILDIIMRCIVEMPFRRREVAVRLMAGITTKEIGLDLDIPPGTVRVHKVFLRRDLVKRLRARGLEVKYYGKKPQGD